MRPIRYAPITVALAKLSFAGGVATALLGASVAIATANASTSDETSLRFIADLLHVQIGPPWAGPLASSGSMRGE